MKSSLYYKKLYRELIKQAKSKGFKIKEVDPDLTGDFIGMNPEAAKDFGFKMPEDTIYIDRNLSYSVKYHTLKHELVEIQEMGKGKCYWDAHTVALRKER